MRFYSWNVNGFRAVLKKGFMDWLEEADPDVLNLQEIRCEWEEVDLGVRREIESAYDVSWFPSTVKKGYAGSATLSRKELGFKHAKGLGLPDVDGEGRILVSTLGKLTFIAGYFPNASHQVIILSTDTEVDETSYNELQPHIARAYHLDYDEHEKTTTARQGYFWHTPSSNGSKRKT